MPMDLLLLDTLFKLRVLNTLGVLDKLSMTLHFEY